MNSTENMLYTEEYSTLRDELLQNKQYVFERPLIIITAAGIAAVQLSGEPSVVFLPLLLTIVLLSNLWFTVNRFMSTARISAYVASVLEPTGDLQWIGWENSLRLYRIWTKKTPVNVQAEKIAEIIDHEAIPDTMMFYPALWWVHIATGILSLIVSIASYVKEASGISTMALVLTSITTIVFIFYCFGPYYPSRMRDLIERNRAIWSIVLKNKK